MVPPGPVHAYRKVAPTERGKRASDGERSNRELDSAAASHTTESRKQ
jgi:hypothetical protein